VPDVEEGIGEPDSALMRATAVGLAGNSNAWPMAMSLVAKTMAIASMCKYRGQSGARLWRRGHRQSGRAPWVRGECADVASRAWW
jgi:hypothetical protein